MVPRRMRRRGRGVDAFLDCVITGVGCTETRIDYDEEPDGKAVIDRVDPLEIYWDSGANKKICRMRAGYSGSRTCRSTRRASCFPMPTIAISMPVGRTDQSGDAQDPHDAEQAPFYRHDQSGRLDKQQARVRLVEAQWWVYETVIRTVDPFTGQELALSADDHATLVDRLAALGQPAPPSVTQRRRKYRRAVLGSKLLKVWDGPRKGRLHLEIHHRGPQPQPGHLLRLRQGDAGPAALGQ